MYTLLVTGDVPGAASYFNPLLQQTVIPCTSGTRPTPTHEGMTVYETDTDRISKWTGAAWEPVCSSRQSYTPQILASSSNPTMGTASVTTSHYTLLPGPTVFYSFYIRFGSSGAAAGTGTYSITLPITASAAGIGGGGEPAMGTAKIRDSSSSTTSTGMCWIQGSELGVVQLIINQQVVTSTVPWTWANSDSLSGSITYPIA